MPFPIRPDRRFNESDSLFRVHDPFGLRKAITPVFIGHHTTGRMQGCGTSFFITPFGRQLSAMHVITDFFNERRIPVLPNTSAALNYTDAAIEILHDPGLVFGTCPAGTILVASEFVMFPVDQAENPLRASMHAHDLIRAEPSLDLTAWNIQQLGERRTQYLPVSVGRGRPPVKVGDRVMAVGYPTNNGERKFGRSITSYQEEMFASVGQVIDIRTEWDQSLKRWPALIVDVHWPPGMSGGPVFDEVGNVVGIVSRGGEDWSEALWLQRLPYSRPIFGNIDPDRPGWITGWGVCNTVSCVELFQTQEAAQQFADTHGPSLTIQHVSIRYRPRN